MKKQVRYSPEVRERAVRLVHEQQNEYEFHLIFFVCMSSRTSGIVPRHASSYTSYAIQYFRLCNARNLHFLCSLCAVYSCGTN